LWWRLGFPFIFLTCSTSGKGMCEGRAYLWLVTPKKENSVMYVVKMQQ
jgi:hypothetical protein